MELFLCAAPRLFHLIAVQRSKKGHRDKTDRKNNIYQKIIIFLSVDYQVFNLVQIKNF